MKDCCLNHQTKFCPDCGARIKLGGNGVGATFGQKLNRVIGSRSRADVSAMAGVPVQTITNYINRGTEPGLTAAAKLARALDVSLDWLSDETQSWPPIRIQSTIDNGDSTEQAAQNAA